jgi:transcriptional regulator with XRE-family HTH domain
MGQVPEPSPLAELGARLAGLRRRRGLTQEQLAERSGLSVRAIRYLERGSASRARPGTVRLLADALDLPAEVRAQLLAALEPAPPRELPADPPAFVGRRAEVARLLAALAPGRGTVVALSGPAGVGKTALALHVAHRAQAGYPAGVLFARLGDRDPAEVAAGFLRVLGVADRGVPADPERRAALLRSRLAATPALVVLDDAAGEAQVRPLLPGTGGSAVLVTGRQPLAGLDDGVRVEVGVLPAADARALLAGVAGAGRVDPADPALADVLAYCGGLPLALRVAAGRLRAREHWRVADLAGSLSDSRRRLDGLQAGDLSVRASIEVSYRALPGPAAAAFRLLGLLDAPDLAAWPVAALLGVPLAAAAALVEQLADVRLLDVAGRDATGTLRYRPHDLVRLYARERAEQEEEPAARRAAVERALGQWFLLARAAEARLPVGGLGGRTAAAPAPALTAAEAAGLLASPVDWLEAEREALVAAVGQAARLGLGDLCWDLAGALASFFELRSRGADWERSSRVALAAARAAGSARGEARMLLSLSELAVNRQRLDGVPADLRRAAALFGAEADPAGRAHALHDLAILELTAGRPGPAAEHETEALAVFRALDEPQLVGVAAFGLGAMVRDQGRPAEALALFDEAATALAKAGDRLSLGNLSTARGRLRLHLRDPAGAEADIRTGLALAREIDNRQGEARALRALAEWYLEAGDPRAADQLLTATLTLATTLESAFDQAHTLALQARTHDRQGRTRDATDARDRARTLFLELGLHHEAQALAGRH